MKKIIVTVALLIASISVTYAQYKPTKADIGKDCSAQGGKLGTWKEVTVEERSGNSSSFSTNSSGSMSVGADAKVVKGKVSGSVSAGKSSSSDTSETIRYNDIRCVEDKNANLPQQTPVRW